MLPSTRELAEVRNIVCKPSGSDPTGELKTAYLTLHTKVIFAQSSIGSSYYDHKILFEHAIEMGVGYASFNFTRDWSRKCTHDDAFPSFRPGFISISDLCIAEHVSPFEVAIVQATVWCGKRSIDWYQVDDEIRIYLVLARDTSNEEHWIRCGLMLVAEHDDYIPSDEESDATGENDGAVTEERQDIIPREHTKRGRQIFQLFDKLRRGILPSGEYRVEQSPFRCYKGASP